MKVVQSGSQYRIYSNDLKTYDQFPVGTYTIRFSDMTGFYLVPHDNLAVQEKIYGPHLKKAQKVMASFAEFERSLGVILSGPKGMGKSFFARILSNEVNKAGMPVIIVDTYYGGISSFIESITQECAVLFDEFDKVFDSDDVNTMLSLFDGTGSGKKLYIVTCNQISKMNDYIVNRPGRFHYHFRFEYPSNDEIRTYMQDKLDPVYYGQIDKVVEFSNKVNLNYDCLRAIAFELNHGEDFADAIEDLNIINIDRQQYKLSIHFNDGTVFIDHYYDRYDLFSDSTFNHRFEDETGYDYCYVTLNTKDIVFNGAQICIPADKMKVSWCSADDDDSETYKETLAKLKKCGVNHIEFHRKAMDSYSYMV